MLSVRKTKFTITSLKLRHKSLCKHFLKIIEKHFPIFFKNVDIIWPDLMAYYRQIEMPLWAALNKNSLQRDFLLQALAELLFYDMPQQLSIMQKNGVTDRDSVQEVEKLLTDVTLSLQELIADLACCDWVYEFNHALYLGQQTPEIRNQKIVDLSKKIIFYCQKHVFDSLLDDESKGVLILLQEGIGFILNASSNLASKHREEEYGKFLKTTAKLFKYDFQYNAIKLRSECENLAATCAQLIKANEPIEQIVEKITALKETVNYYIWIAKLIYQRQANSAYQVIDGFDNYINNFSDGYKHLDYVHTQLKEDSPYLHEILTCINIKKTKAQLCSRYDELIKNKKQIPGDFKKEVDNFYCQVKALKLDNVILSNAIPTLRAQAKGLHETIVPEKTYGNTNYRKIFFQYHKLEAEAIVEINMQTQSKQSNFTL